MSARDRTWTFDAATQQLRHDGSMKCLGAEVGKPVAQKCEAGATRQQWLWRPL